MRTVAALMTVLMAPATVSAQAAVSGGVVDAASTQTAGAPVAPPAPPAWKAAVPAVDANDLDPEHLCSVFGPANAIPATSNPPFEATACDSLSVQLGNIDAIANGHRGDQRVADWARDAHRKYDECKRSSLAFYESNQAARNRGAAMENLAILLSVKPGARVVEETKRLIAEGAVCRADVAARRAARVAAIKTTPIEQIAAVDKKFLLPEEQAAINEENQRRGALLVKASADPRVMGVVFSASMCVAQDEAGKIRREIKTEHKYSRVGGAIDLERMDDLQWKLRQKEMIVTNIRKRAREAKAKLVACGSAAIARAYACEDNEALCTDEQKLYLYLGSSLDRELAEATQYQDQFEE